jgi:two-component system sensor histidine kinase/response regulator
VTFAENGKKAVEAFQAEPEGTYLAILMDVQMPILNGYEAARAIRSLSRDDAKKIPIYAMTADAFATDVKKAEESGMNGHISKPINPQELYECLQKSIMT